MTIAQSSRAAWRNGSNRTPTNLSTHMKTVEHNLRDPSQVHTTAMRFIELWRVVCKNEDVTAKAEIPREVRGRCRVRACCR